MDKKDRLRQAQQIPHFELVIQIAEKLNTDGALDEAIDKAHRAKHNYDENIEEVEFDIDELLKGV